MLVGLSSWIIQDGNYGDFALGDRAAFALEFFAPDPVALLGSGADHEPVLIHANRSVYHATGKVVHVDKDWWVIDSGFLMYNGQRPPKGVHVGRWVRGPVEVSVDCFTYFERLAQRPNAPALIYDWSIEKIERDGQDIAATNAWHEGLAEYVLHCRRLHGSPRTTK